MVLTASPRTSLIDLVVADGDELFVRYDTVIVAARVTVAGRLVCAPGVSVLVVAQEIVIAGTAHALPAARGHGGSLAFHASERLVVSGAIAAGHGARGQSVRTENAIACAGDGGRGGSVALRAPLLWVRGSVRAGDGGAGGDATSVAACRGRRAEAHGGAGGAGGAIHLAAAQLEAASATLLVGNGGDGGSANASLSSALSPGDARDGSDCVSAGGMGGAAGSVEVHRG